MNLSYIIYNQVYYPRECPISADTLTSFEHFPRYQDQCLEEHVISHCRRSVALRQLDVQQIGLRRSYTAVLCIQATLPNESTEPPAVHDVVRVPNPTRGSPLSGTYSDGRLTIVMH